MTISWQDVVFGCCPMRMRKYKDVSGWQPQKNGDKIKDVVYFTISSSQFNYYLKYKPAGKSLSLTDVLFLGCHADDEKQECPGSWYEHARYVFKSDDRKVKFEGWVPKPNGPEIYQKHLDKIKKELERKGCNPEAGDKTGVKDIKPLSRANPLRNVKCVGLDNKEGPPRGLHPAIKEVMGTNHPKCTCGPSERAILAGKALPACNPESRVVNDYSRYLTRKNDSDAIYIPQPSYGVAMMGMASYEDDDVIIHTEKAVSRERASLKAWNFDKMAAKRTRLERLAFP